MFDVDNALDFDETANLSVWQKDVDSLLRQNQCEDALDTAENALAQCQSEGDVKGAVAASNSVARCHFAARSYEKALSTAQDALVEAQRANATAEEPAILHTIAKAQMYMKRLSAAADSAENAMDKYIAKGNKTGEAAVLLTTGCLNLLEGNVTKAFESTEKAMELYEEVGETAGKVSVMHTQIAVYGVLSRYPEAFEMSMQSVALLRNTEDKQRLAAVLLMAADMAVPAGEIEEGLKCAKEALSLFEKFDASAGKTTALCAVAKAYMADKRWAHAVNSADEAMEAAKDSGKLDQATACFLGTTIRRQKAGHGTESWPPKRGIPEEDLTEFHECAEKSVQLYKDVEDDLGEAAARFELAYSHLAHGDQKKAVDELQMALNKFQFASEKVGEGNTMYTMAQVKMAMGDKSGAIKYMNQSIDILKELDLGNAVKIAEKILADMEKPPRVFEESATKLLLKKPEGKIQVNTGAGSEGGISASLYSSLIWRSMMIGKSHGEHIFEHPQQVIMLQSMIGIKFPFWRGQKGDEHPNIAPSEKEKASGRKKVKKAEGEDVGEIDLTRATSFMRAVDFQAQVKKVTSEFEKEEVKPPPGGSVVGDDLLGGRAFDCPEELHEEMLGLAASNDIPVTTPAQRKENLEKRPTFYGTPALREAVRWGYVHPSMKAPYGLVWKQVRPGAYKLKPIAGAA